MRTRVGAVTGATAEAIVEVLLRRPLAGRPVRAGELTRWQAFNTLWRQEWHGPEPEDRRLRWFAGVFSLVWHLFFAGLLMWLMYVRFLELEQEASKRRGEEVVQVEFIGRGAPAEIGGAQSPQEAEAVEEQAAAAAQPERTAADRQDVEAEQAEAASSPELSAPPAAAVSVDIQVPDVEVPEVAPREVPEPPAQQNVVVSAPTPEVAEFTLPPPTPPDVQPPIAVPELSSPARPLQVAEVPEPVQPSQREPLPVRIIAPDLAVPQRQPPTRDIAEPLRPTIRQLPQQSLDVPQIEVRTPGVPEREVAAPLPSAPARAVAAPVLAAPTVSAPETGLRIRDIPAPAAADAQPTAPAAESAAGAVPSAPATPQGPHTQAPAPAVAAPSSAQAGQGPRPVVAPGGFPTPRKDDDWGDSTREVAGGQRGEPRGLYDAEGGPRLTEDPINTGQPPGTLDDRIVDLDRSGTWLKRKPTDYEPTTFDKYWRPNESLLQEWVRKGIKKMAIPIPGTNKRIECLVSILALGGGCGISDPNLNEQPASARPPPDIPFKPHLQEKESSGSTPAEG